MARRLSIALLEVDPGLGTLCSPERLEAATRRLVVHEYRVEPGRWDGERLQGAGPEHIGLLMVEGLMTRELVLSDNVAAELLGPGDVIRPWAAEAPDRLVRHDVRWTVLEPTRFAVLDRRFAAALPQYPEVNAMLIDRIAERSKRLEILQAIAQLNGVDRRLLTLFWHLAERWGHVTTEGVAISVAVPHRVVAQIVGARRPTVSTALSVLADRGELIRKPDGRWLLTGAPVGMPTEAAKRIVRRRRPSARPMAPATADALPLTGRIGELHDALAGLREANARTRERFHELSRETEELIERIGAQRSRRERALDRDGDGARDGHAPARFPG